MGSIAAMLAVLVPLTALRAQGVDTAAARSPDTASQRDSSTYHRDSTRADYDESVVPGLRVVDVADDGTFITLQDGTRWEVYLPDRPSTVQWKPGDFVTVKLAPIAQGRYTYRLGNGRTDTDVVVKFRGRAGAGG